MIASADSRPPNDRLAWMPGATVGVTPRNGQNRTLSRIAQTELALKAGFVSSAGEQAWPKTKDFGHALKRGRIARNRRDLRASRQGVYGHPPLVSP